MQLIWQEFLGLIRNEVGSQIVDTWFKSASLLSWDRQDNVLEIGVPNQFVNSWIRRNYLYLFKKHLTQLTKQDQLDFKFRVFSKKDFVVNEDKDEGSVKEGASSLPLLSLASSGNFKQRRPVVRKSVLNSKYTFENFIVGPNNHLAYSAAQSIAAGKAHSYNPLFIYGKSGLGKTHLLHCIGNYVLEKNPQAKVVYRTSDAFIGDFIKSIRQDRIIAFKDKYSRVDYLLIDDVQFFSQKEQTQEIFFNIFNKMYEGKKQIVLTSDTTPYEIVGLHERLKSRFGWGLVADVVPPSLETKSAILLKKTEEMGIKIGRSVADFIAASSHSNIRSLESSLTRLAAMTALSGREITLDLVQKEMALTKDKPAAKVACAESIMKTVTEECGVLPKEISSRGRSGGVVEARQLGAYLLKKHTTHSLKAIGSYIGGRNHSTVIHAISQVENKIKTDFNFARRIEKIERKVGG